MNQNTVTKTNGSQNFSGRRRARSKALRFLSGFASQVRDPEEAAELERIAAFVRERESADELRANTTEG